MNRNPDTGLPLSPNPPLPPGSRDPNAPIFPENFQIEMEHPDGAILIACDAAPQEYIDTKIDYALRINSRIGHVAHPEILETYRNKRWYLVEYTHPENSKTTIVIPVEEEHDGKNSDRFVELVGDLAESYMQHADLFAHYTGVAHAPDTTILLLPSEVEAGGSYDRRDQTITAPRPPVGAIRSDESYRRAVSVVIHERTHQQVNYGNRPNIIQLSEGIPLLFQELIVGDRSPRSFPLVQEASLNLLRRNTHGMQFANFEIDTIYRALGNSVGGELDRADILYISGYAIARGLFKYATGVNLGNYSDIATAVEPDEIKAFISHWEFLLEWSATNPDMSLTELLQEYILAIETQLSQNDPVGYPPATIRDRAKTAMNEIGLDLKDVMVNGFIQEATRVKLAKANERERRTREGLSSR